MKEYFKIEHSTGPQNSVIDRKFNISSHPVAVAVRHAAADATDTKKRCVRGIYFVDNVGDRVVVTLLELLKSDPF
jgi:hypothetical protein